MCAERGRVLSHPERQRPCRRRGRAPGRALALLGLALLGSAAPAAASEPEELFERGLADLQAGRYGPACDALHKSYRFERRPRTLFYLAECEERAGRVATAALHYDEYLDLVERLSPPEQKDEADRQKLALARRDRLDIDIPRVTFRLPGTAPAGTKVTRSSKASPDPVPVTVGVPLPIDPGEHWVRTEPPGAPARDKRFFVNKRERLSIDLTVAEAGDEARTPRRSVPVTPVPPVLPISTDDGLSGRRLVMYIAGGVGLVGVIAGAVAGGVTLTQKKTIADNCRDGFCNEKGESAIGRAAVASPISTVSFAVGLTGLTVATALLLTEPEPARVGGAPRRRPVAEAAPRLWVGFSGHEAVAGGAWVW
ncbi:tetratricopeptide repeat protein [Sorangium sp. So ce1024]|uniref:tetratricopeptide repeat protein n=1 Tax=Sorangium sp. So ce1024 TaxID=3133327 RepID=UPI003F12327B